MGSFWGRSSDRSLLGLLTIEQFVANIYQHGEAAIHPGDVVFDVGSHLGTFTRYALDKGTRLVVAFEPELTNITCFKRTFAQEIAAGRILLVEAALWETPGTLNFAERPANSGAGRVSPSGRGGTAITVPATTMDDTVERLGVNRVDFVKMDIEGAERHALLGARETLSRFGPRMAICIYHREDDPVVVPEIVLAARPSYQVLTYDTQVYFY